MLINFAGSGQWQYNMFGVASHPVFCSTLLLMLTASKHPPKATSPNALEAIRR